MPFKLNEELKKLENNNQSRTQSEKLEKKHNNQTLGNDGGNTNLLYQGDINQAARDRVVQQNTPWTSSFQGGAQYDENGNPYHYNKEKGNINLEILITLIIIALGIFYFFRLLLKK